LIQLFKTACPQILIDNAAKWTAELIKEIAAGGNKIAARTAKYNQPAIKDQLRLETHKKCAYCESKFTHVTYGDIEHIVPKSTDVNVTFDWDNMTLSCDICNTNKGDTQELVDPYAVDPEAEFEFLGPMIHHRMGCAVAEITHRTLKLNRIDLLDRRRDHIDSVMGQVERIVSNGDAATRKILLGLYVGEITKCSAEYAACSKGQVDRLKANGVI